MAHPTECQVVNEITMARQLPKVMPLFVTFLVFSFIGILSQRVQHRPDGVQEGTLAPGIYLKEHCLAAAGGDGRNKERLPAFAQVDVRVDKTFYLKHCMLGFYLDLQNITVSKLKQQDVLMSTGIIENPEAPAAAQRYRMKRIKQSSGTLLPTLGITFEY